MLRWLGGSISYIPEQNDHHHNLKGTTIDQEIHWVRIIKTGPTKSDTDLWTFWFWLTERKSCGLTSVNHRCQVCKQMERLVWCLLTFIWPKFCIYSINLQTNLFIKISDVSVEYMCLLIRSDSDTNEHPSWPITTQVGRSVKRYGKFYIHYLSIYGNY